jgi:YegS/Rv2252/BmrU family lipid kinase
MSRIKIILNPIAGRGYGARSEPEIRRFLETERADFDLVLTEGFWHAAELAEQAIRDGFDLIVAAGGDGTVHEVVNGMMATAKDDTGGGGIVGTLGTLPVGSGSDFSHNVGTPSDLPGACQRLLHGQIRIIDVGRVTVDDQPTRYFDNTINVGFGGTVTLEARKVKWVRGIALYLPVVLKTIFLARSPRMTVKYNAKEITMPMLMVTVGNGAREGGGFFCTPDAEPDDGLLDLCIAEAVSKLTQLSLVPRFMDGSHKDHPAVTMARTQHAVITSPDNLVAHADGEMLCTEGHRLEFEILPRRLQVMC